MPAVLATSPGGVAGVIAAVLALLGALYRWGPGAWRTLLACARAPLTIERVLYEDPRRLEAVTVRLATIEAEFSPNCGGSMRDAVNRIERNQRLLADAILEHVRDEARHSPAPVKP